MMTASAEYTTLLATLRQTPEDLTMLQQSSPDWPLLLRQATQHEIVPLLYGSLSSLPLSAQPPKDLLLQMRAVYVQVSGRQLRLYHNLGQILSALRDAGVPVIVLKGAHLAALVYADPAYRQMVDIDLLIHQHTLSAARAALASIGYQAREMYPHDSDETHHEHLTPLAGGCPVELHWTLNRQDVRRSGLVMDDIWARACPVTIAETETLALSPIDLYLYLCQHLYFHGLRVTLRQVLDLAACVRYYRYTSSDWTVLRQRAADWEIERSVVLLTALIRAWSCPQIPTSAIDPGSTSQADWEVLLAQAESRILQGSEPDVLPDAVSRLFGQRSFSDKWAILRSRLFPPRSTVAQLYGLPPSSLLVFPCYLVWQARLLRTYGGRLARRGGRASSAARSSLFDWLDGVDTQER